MNTKATIQLDQLHPEVDKLQKLYGSPDLNAIYGAGQVLQPKLLLLFMNPTSRNISAAKDWLGIRAPWLGTKNIWRLLYAAGLLDAQLLGATQTKVIDEWTKDFAQKLYESLSNNSVYITNLAKCTQVDARALANSVFRTYLDNTLRELQAIRPVKIVTFGNQVSSVLLGRNIRVSDYGGAAKEVLEINGNSFEVYPCFYPIGQGMRNFEAAVTRLRSIINS